MTDLAGQTRQFTSVANRSNLVFGGNTYVAYVGPNPDYNLSIDLNHDGTIGDGANTAYNVGCTSALTHTVGLSINATGGRLDPTAALAAGDTKVGPCRAAVVIQGGESSTSEYVTDATRQDTSAY